jgi:predicted transcriptional regulator
MSLTDNQKLEIVEAVALGHPQSRIAEAMGISQQMVSKLVRAGAKRGRHGGDRKGKRYRRALVKRAKNQIWPK